MAKNIKAARLSHQVDQFKTIMAPHALVVIEITVFVQNSADLWCSFCKNAVSQMNPIIYFLF